MGLLVSTLPRCKHPAVSIGNASLQQATVPRIENPWFGVNYYQFESLSGIKGVSSGIIQYNYMVSLYIVSTVFKNALSLCIVFLDSSTRSSSRNTEHPHSFSIQYQGANPPIFPFKPSPTSTFSPSSLSITLTTSGTASACRIFHASFLSILPSGPGSSP